VINIGLEGTMLASAFTGVVISAYAQDWFGESTGTTIGPWLGLGVGLLVAALMALLLAFFHLKLKANLILSGIALNTLGSAATIALMYELTGQKGNTNDTLNSLSMPFIQLPEALQHVPVLSFFFGVFDNQSVMTWIAFIAVIVVWYFMYRTPTGVHLRAVGENPAAAASVGIHVTAIRYLALILSGILAGLGGIHMSMGYLGFFQSDMTNQRGFIALATPALGGGNPIGTAIASLVFGFFAGLRDRLGQFEFPAQLTEMVPYLATVMALVIYALQAKLTNRVRTLRAAEGEHFDVRFWKSIQRLSVLHMFLAVLAVIGLIVSISMFAAPKGFSGKETTYPRGAAVGIASLLLIAINMPFMLKVERIGSRLWWGAAAAVTSLGVYLGGLFSLYFATVESLRQQTVMVFIVGGLVGLLLASLIWLMQGGFYLLLKQYPAVSKLKHQYFHFDPAQKALLANGAALVMAAIMVIAFMVLPWLSANSDAHLSADQDQTQTALQITRDDVYDSQEQMLLWGVFALIVIGGVFALACFIKPEYSRYLSLAVMAVGVALVVLVSVTNNSISGVDKGLYDAGAGCALVVWGGLVMIGQVFVPRPTNQNVAVYQEAH
jgi:simple sugar transport system permease protein